MNGSSRRALTGVLAAAVVAIAGIWVVYFAVGRRLIEELYAGRLTSVMGIVLEGRSEHALTFYFKFAENLLAVASLGLLLVMVYVFFLIRERRAIAGVFREERGWRPDAVVTSFRARPLGRRRLVLLLALFAASFALYAWQGSRLLTSPAVSEDSLLFEADPRLTAHDMTQFRADYYSTPSRHPLFVLFVNPTGSLVNLILPEFTVALLLNSLIGALGVGLAFLIFDRWRDNVRQALLFAILYGVTMSHFFFSSLPETYALAALTLFVTYAMTIISVKQKRVDFWPWVIAGILAMGVTATNGIQTLICFAFAARAARRTESPTASVLPAVLALSLAMGAGVIVLSLLQKLIYPAAGLFFWPPDQHVSFGYVDFSPLLHPLDLLARELKHFVLANFVAPLPAVISWPGTALPALTYDTPLSFTVLGWIGAALWIVIFAAGTLSSAAYDGSDRPVLAALFSCVSFNLVLHSFYGTGVTGRMEFFLYSMHFTFPLLFLILAAWNLRRLRLNLLMAVLAVVWLANNMQVIQHMLNVYANF